ncbi:hypothetical protein Q8F55_002069 [Vanrija albida]|uniref:FAD/NAD(P)-binding domain-containing protein n=1 Tax=Vanrija albida TaxID=181172 RepID=A0ABR3Q8Q7_9TREE
MTIPAAPQAEYFSFERPIRKVALIGVGAAGATAVRHLRDAGLEVHAYERQGKAGGVWNWQPDVAPPLSVPTPAPSVGAFTPELPSTPLGSSPAEPTTHDISNEDRLKFNPPNPVYWNLTNNVPTTAMVYKDYPYPEGTLPNVKHSVLSEYINGYVKHFDLAKHISFWTRVEKIDRIPESEGSAHRWRVTLHKAEPVAEGKVSESWWTEDVDGLIIGTGHYNAPFIPNLEGAKEWAEAWPEQVLHSNGYRYPEPYAGKVGETETRDAADHQNILIVGAGTSGIDIARDLTAAAKIYLVTKPITSGPEDAKKMRQFQRSFLPDNTEGVPEIKRFLPPKAGEPVESGRVELVDGRIIDNVSLVLLSTGYQYSIPFLPQFHHDPALGPVSDEEKAQLLITDGRGVLNLHRDVFFNADPTITFIGLSVNTAAFNFFEYQGIAVSRVFSGKARLPALPRRLEEYAALIQEKGEGKYSHFMGKVGEIKYVRKTVEWLNADADVLGAPHVEGHTQEWLAASDKLYEVFALKYNIPIEQLRAERGLPAKGFAQEALEHEQAREQAAGVGAVTAALQQTAIVA